jgi:hypothetical protein
MELMYRIFESKRTATKTQRHKEHKEGIEFIYSFTAKGEKGMNFELSTLNFEPS